MSFLSDLAKTIADYSTKTARSHYGGTVLEGAQEGKTAQQITAMLSGAIRATARPPADLPQRRAESSAGGGGGHWATQAIKLFPKSVIIQKAAAQERREQIDFKHAAAGHVKMARDMTDPAFLQTISRGGAPPSKERVRPVEKMTLGVLGKLAAMLPGPFKLAGAAIGLGVAVAKMPSIISSMAMGRLQEQDTLSRYSGRIARTMALMQVQDIHLGMRQARATAASTEFLGRQTRNLRETMQPYSEAWGVAKNVGLGLGAGYVDWLAKSHEIMAKLASGWYVANILSGGNAPTFGATKQSEMIPVQEFLRVMNPGAKPHNQGVPRNGRND